MDRYDEIAKRVYDGARDISEDGDDLHMFLLEQIAAALRAEGERAAKEERDECLKDARMYELGDNVNWDDPMAARQNQIAQAIIRMIESRGERKEAAIRARGRTSNGRDV